MMIYDSVKVVKACHNSIYYVIFALFSLFCTVIVFLKKTEGITYKNRWQCEQVKTEQVKSTAEFL